MACTRDAEGDGLQMWKVPVYTNVLNKHSQRGDKVSLSVRLCSRLITTHRRNKPLIACYEMLHGTPDVVVFSGTACGKEV